MVYFALCVALLRGPVPRALLPETMVAERFFADIERLSGKEVRRVEPKLDTLLVTCRIRREDQLTFDLLILILRAHGIYLHPVRDERGGEAFFASLSPSPPPKPVPHRSFAFYSPKHVKPEDLVSRLKDHLPPGIRILVDPRTGKIILSGKSEEAVRKAKEKVRSSDKPPRRERLYHLYRCVGMFVHDAYKKLLRRLPTAVRRRVVFVPYRKTNTLVVACGSKDWRTILTLLKEINPQGEVPGPSKEE